MSTATARPTASSTTTRPLWQVGLLSGLSGGLAALGVGLAAVALDVPMQVAQPDGTVAAVPLPAYVIATVVAALAGAGLAALLRRRVDRPSRTFAVVAWGLTALSLVQPALLADDAGTAVVLGLSHLAAAAVIIPWLSSALRAGPARTGA